jgi:hypothetical protein
MKKIITGALMLSSLSALAQDKLTINFQISNLNKKFKFERVHTPSGESKRLVFKEIETSLHQKVSYFGQISCQNFNEKVSENKKSKENNFIEIVEQTDRYAELVVKAIETDPSTQKSRISNLSSTTIFLPIDFSKLEKKLVKGQKVGSHGVNPVNEQYQIDFVNEFVDSTSQGLKGGQLEGSTVVTCGSLWDPREEIYKVETTEEPSFKITDPSWNMAIENDVVSIKFPSLEMEYTSNYKKVK